MVDLRELWARRDLVVLLARRDLKARYKQAALGLAWTILQPLVGMAVLWFVFWRVAGVTGANVPYPVFALAGFVAWSYVAQTVQAVAGSLLAHGPMLTKVYLPRLAVPLSATLPGLVHLGVGTAVLLAVVLVAGVTPSVGVVAVPLCVLLAVAAALGVGLWLATLNVAYRDVGPAIGHLIQIWFLATPVAYPAAAVRGSWRLVVAVNPATAAVESFRAAVLGAELPIALVGVSAAIAGVVLAGGLVLFGRLERGLVDQL